MINRTTATFFYILTGIAAIATVIIFWPYMVPLALAGVCAVVAYPIQRFFLGMFKGRKTWAALCSVIVVVVLILGPLISIGTMVFNEVSGIYDSFVNDTGSIAFADYVGRAQIALDHVLPDNWVPEVYVTDLEKYADNVYAWIKGHVQGIFTNILSFLGALFIFIMGLFFFLRDGEKFRATILTISPLQNHHDEKLMNSMAIAMRSVVVGTLFVSLLQGIFAGIGFVVVGLPSPVLWASAAALAALIPSVGTAVITVPIAIFVGAVSGWWWGLGLLIYSILIVGSIDNFLRPFLIERKVNIHPFLILLSVFGGISVIGFSGFILGPIVLCLLFTLAEMYKDVILPETV